MGKARQGKIVISNGSDRVEFGMSNSIYPFKAKMWRVGMGHGGVGWRYFNILKIEMKELRGENLESANWERKKKFILVICSRIYILKKKYMIGIKKLNYIEI